MRPILEGGLVMVTNECYIMFYLNNEYVLFFSFTISQKKKTIRIKLHHHVFTKQNI